MGPYYKPLSLSWFSVFKVSTLDNVELPYNDIAERSIPRNQAYLLLGYSKGKFTTSYQVFTKAISRANIMEHMKKLCKQDDLLCSWRNWNIFYLFINALITGPLLMSPFIICYHKVATWVLLFKLVPWEFCTMNFEHIHLPCLNSSQIHSSPFSFHPIL